MTNYAAATQLHALFDDVSGEAKKEIEETIGDISDFEIWGDLVLVAVYCRPVQTRGGFHIGNEMPLEDVYQGKVGLILKIGPDAFTEVDKTFNGRKPAVGEWVYHNVNQTEMQLSLAGNGWKRRTLTAPNGSKEDARKWDGWPVRLVSSRHIYGRIQTPGIIV